MKVLKILAIVFGVILLLTGGGLLVGSYAAGKGDDAIARQIQASGLEGPVDGVVTDVAGQSVTVDYTDARGEDHTASGQAALTKPAEVGDTVSVYYSPDQPDVVVVTNLAGGLTALASGLKTGGIVSLILGGLLLLAGILGLVLGKKTPAIAGGPPPGQQYPAQQYPPQGQGYPPQGQGYPPQSGQGYPPQGPQGQQYPPQPGPGEQYPPQSGQGYQPPPGQPGQGQPGQGQPGQQYPQQLKYPDQQPPPQYPSQPPTQQPPSYPPQPYPPAGPPSAQ
jgi:hypothetical protein